jgi:hypothetical protein
MTNINTIKNVAYRPVYGLNVVKMWRQPFQRAMNMQQQNHSDDLNRQLDYFSTIAPASIRLAMDGSSSTVAGLMALTASTLDHLYIRV